MYRQLRRKYKIILEIYKIFYGQMHWYNWFECKIHKLLKTNRSNNLSRKTDLKGTYLNLHGKCLFCSQNIFFCCFQTVEQTCICQTLLTCIKKTKSEMHHIWSFATGVQAIIKSLNLLNIWLLTNIKITHAGNYTLISPFFCPKLCLSFISMKLHMEV